MTATAQAKKDKVIAALVDARTKILDAVSSLSPEQQDEVFLGVWSVKDLLAHLAGWDFANIQAAKDILAGKLPSFYAYYDRDWKSYNAHLVAEYKRARFVELVALVEDSHRQLIDFLRTIPPEEFDKDIGLRSKGWIVTIARLMQVEAKDERAHHRQVKQFKDRS